MIERRIIIGLITSTDYLKTIQSIWNQSYLESSTAKHLARWCWEYFEKYQKAPGKDIEAIYYTKIRSNKFPKQSAEEIEQDILPGLSKEYEKTGADLKPLLDDTSQYFLERKLSILSTSIQALIKDGQLEEAEKMIDEFKTLSTSPINLENFILDVATIRNRKKKKPMLLMKPWLREGQFTIIYGNYGTGKSLLTLTICYLLGLREPDAEFGPWRVKNSTGTLYIDGELGEQEMEERVSKLEWLGKQKASLKLRILSVPEYQHATEDHFHLSDRPNQLKIINWLKGNPDYKVVVLDSVSTLFGLEEENSNSEWNNKVNPFLRDLRAINVACILLHHAGKDNKKGLRGASSMGAMAENIYRLTNSDHKLPEAGEAYFKLTKDKQRAGGFSFNPFSAHFFQENNDKEIHWEIT